MSSTRTSPNPSESSTPLPNSFTILQDYARHCTSALQIEHHPYLVQPMLMLIDQRNDIVVAAYCSFFPQRFLELPAAFRKRVRTPCCFLTRLLSSALLCVGPAKIGDGKGYCSLKQEFVFQSPRIHLSNDTIRSPFLIKGWEHVRMLLGIGFEKAVEIWA